MIKPVQRTLVKLGSNEIAEFDSKLAANLPRYKLELLGVELLDKIQDPELNVIFKSIVNILV